MALPPSGEITLNQIKAEFGRGDNLTAYYGAAPGVPTSGEIKLTDFYGKKRPDYHYGYPYSFTQTNLGYLYSYVENDAGRSGWYGNYNLDSWHGDNWGAYQDDAQTEMSMSIVNTGDAAYAYNPYTQLWFSVDSKLFDANKSNSMWYYNNFVSANAIYYYDFSNAYYNATYVWQNEAYYGGEYWMEMS